MHLYRFINDFRGTTVTAHNVHLIGDLSKSVVMVWAAKDFNPGDEVLTYYGDSYPWELVRVYRGGSSLVVGSSSTCRQLSGIEVIDLCSISSVSSFGGSTLTDSRARARGIGGEIIRTPSNSHRALASPASTIFSLSGADSQPSPCG